MRQIPNFSDSYAFAMEYLFEQCVLSKYPDALIQFDEKEIGMSLEIYVEKKIVYERFTSIPSKRRCIENFFDDMIKKAL